MDYKDIYKIFNDTLINRYKIDWYEVFDKYLELGNHSGIYSDTALLLTLLVDMLPVNNVMEIGSGVSTLFLNKACLDCDVSFVSYEEQDKYLNITKELLLLYKMCPSFLKPYTQTIDFSNVDMLFLDGIDDERVKLLESDKLINIPIIILDDFGSTKLSTAFSNFIKRCPVTRPFYVYNGVGRQDRHQIITWLPDIVDPIGETIARYMPRIGE